MPGTMFAPMSTHLGLAYCRLVPSRLHGQLLEVVQEHLQADVVGHDDLAAHAGLRGVRAAGIELCQQEPRLCINQKRDICTWSTSEH